MSEPDDEVGVNPFAEAKPKKPKKKKPHRGEVEPSPETIASGFARAAAEKEYRISLTSEVARRLRETRR